VAYATAAAATALTGATSADAEIHYSGRVDVAFPSDADKSVAFPLARAGNSFTFIHTVNQGMGRAADFFRVGGVKSGSFVGSYPNFSAIYVFRIKDRNRYISAFPFSNAGGGGHVGTMVNAGRDSLRWRWDGGTGFVGFRFDNGSGMQYGWARVHMDRLDSNFSFTVLDYAWADPGDPIKAGQESSSTMETPNEGALGMLAIGAAGFALWRQRRTR